MDAIMGTVMERGELDAFVDGALSPEASARVVLHLADCPQDAAYVDAVMEANELLAAAYAAPLYEPLPERLRAAIFPAPAPTASRTARRGGWRLRGLTLGRAVGAAVAASLGLAIGLAALPLLRPANSPGIASAALDAALATHASGPVELAAEAPRPAIELTLIGTFFDRDGRPCREYETLDHASGVATKGVACLAGGAGWTTEVAVTQRVAAPERRSEGYVPATGAASAALDETLDRLGAGMSLTPSEEHDLIARNWAH